jgi:hypothetical protein
MGLRRGPSKSVLLRRCGTHPPVARTKHRLGEPSDRERRSPNRRQVARTRRSCHSDDRERYRLLHSCRPTRSPIGTAGRLNPWQRKDAIWFPAGQTRQSSQLLQNFLTTHPPVQRGFECNGLLTTAIRAGWKNLLSTLRGIQICSGPPELGYHPVVLDAHLRRWVDVAIRMRAKPAKLS